MPSLYLRRSGWASLFRLAQPFATIGVAKHPSGANQMTVAEKLNEIKEQIIAD
jgi:deoxyinosine 3'endonuclease (endonuclease V)